MLATVDTDYTCDYVCNPTRTQRNHLSLHTRYKASCVVYYDSLDRVDNLANKTDYAK